MNVIPGSVVSNGNGAEPPKGKGKQAKRSKGRKDADKQPAVTKPQVVSERIDEMVKLHAKSVDAATEAKEAVTKCAEESGYNAANVRKLVLARYGEKFPEVKRNIEQQAELFEEVGED
jgi:hypothetical protein